MKQRKPTWYNITFKKVFNIISVGNKDYNMVLMSNLIQNVFLSETLK